MAKITLKGTPITTQGDLPKVGSTAPNFTLVKTDMSEITLDTYKGKKKILTIFPSIDTPVCATSVKKFNEVAAKQPNTVVICISADLPFAFKRFCGAETIAKVEAASCFRTTFSDDYNVTITDSPLKGLCARAVIVLDETNKVTYTELVPEIAQEPNYDKALAALKN